MKKIFALVASPLVLLIGLITFSPEKETSLETVHYAATTTNAGIAEAPERPTSTRSGSWVVAGNNEQAAPIIDYALSLIGSPYVYGGTSSDGFDCSGFTSHVFDTYGVAITRSSTTQAHDGEAVAKSEARPGDLVIFTGTNPDVREPGHVGIVISEPGDTISFVHSSSNGGVKVSQVQGTRYDERFLGIRRVL